MLELTADLPPQSILERWVGEPVKAVIAPTSIFLTNKKGFPTLSRRHQDFVTALIRYKDSRAAAALTFLETRT